MSDTTGLTTSLSNTFQCVAQDLRCPGDDLGVLVKLNNESSLIKASAAVRKRRVEEGKERHDFFVQLPVPPRMAMQRLLQEAFEKIQQQHRPLKTASRLTARSGSPKPTISAFSRLSNAEWLALSDSAPQLYTAIKEYLERKSLAEAQQWVQNKQGGKNSIR